MATGSFTSGGTIELAALEDKGATSGHSRRSWAHWRALRSPRCAIAPMANGSPSPPRLSTVQSSRRSGHADQCSAVRGGRHVYLNLGVHR
eukprot:IDg15641t1